MDVFLPFFMNALLVVLLVLMVLAVYTVGLIIRNELDMMRFLRLCKRTADCSQARCVKGVDAI